jgi:hypothetical protein
MEVRDAVETDAAEIAEIADAPEDAMRRTIHDRTVRVAVGDHTAGDPNADTDADDSPPLVGFVSFDAREDTVHVTQLGGTPTACERLLAEPMGFAAGEGMAVELLVVEGDETARDAVEAVGFDRVGPGPRFDGQTTTRYRTESP